jgi:hypothetical protein
MDRYWRTAFCALILLCAGLWGATTRNDTLRAGVMLQDSGLLNAASVATDAHGHLIVGSGGASTIVAAGNGITVSQAANTYTVALYTPPSVSSLSNSSPGNYLGQTVNSVTVTWAWTGSAITSQTLTGCTPALSDRSHAFTSLNLTSDYCFTLWGSDGKNAAAASTCVYFYIQKFYGSSPDAAPTAADVQAGTSGWSYIGAGYRSLGATGIAGGGNYPYYSYPASWGNVALTVNSLPATWLKTSVTITNAYGNTQSYTVYTSPNTNGGTITLTATGD